MLDRLPNIWLHWTEWGALFFCSQVQFVRRIRQSTMNKFFSPVCSSRGTSISSAQLVVMNNCKYHKISTGLFDIFITVLYSLFSHLTQCHFLSLSRLLGNDVRDVTFNWSSQTKQLVLLIQLLRWPCDSDCVVGERSGDCVMVDVFRLH